MAGKLERIASVFAGLAGACVEDAEKRNDQNMTMNLNSAFSNSRSTPVALFEQQRTGQAVQWQQQQLQHRFDQSSQAGIGTEVLLPTDSSIDWPGSDLDINSDLLLNYLCASASPPLDPNMASSPSADMSVEPKTLLPTRPQNSYQNDLSEPSGAHMLRSLTERGRKRPLECTFDWFKWDLYYNNQAHNSQKD